MEIQLSQSDLKRINKAIVDHERQTAAEFVSVVIDASDHYRYIPILWASVLSLLLPGMLYLASTFTAFSTLYTAQVASFVALALLFNAPQIKYRLIPSKVKRQRAAHMARQQFLAQRLHHTDHRMGVLLFVSLAEHYVEILADQGVSEKIDNQMWQQIISSFSSEVSEGKLADAFVQTIAQSTHLLREIAPANDAEDTLPNQLIVLNCEKLLAD